MTAKQKEQLEKFESLGFNIKRLTYEQCVDELMHKYVTLADALEYTEEEKFERELKRVLQPTN